jgi:ribosomal-protein-alanine N-acetyltransferase
MDPLHLEPFELIPVHHIDFDEVYAFFMRNLTHLQETTHRYADEFTEHSIRSRLLRSAIESERNYTFRYAVMVNGRMVGYVRIIRLLEKTLNAADVQLAIDRDYQRIGYGTAIGQVVVQKAFTELKFRKLTCTVLVHHHGANRSLIKTGFRRVGTLHKNTFINGEWRDVNLYEIVNLNA